MVGLPAYPTPTRQTSEFTKLNAVEKLQLAEQTASKLYVFIDKELTAMTEVNEYTGTRQLFVNDVRKELNKLIKRRNK